MAKKAKVYTGTEWVDLAAATTDLSQYPNMTTTPISGFRNAIINGDFRVNQRGFTSGSTGGTFLADRWYFNNQGGTGTLTASLQTFTPGASPTGYEGTRFARIVTSGQSATSTRSDLIQNIEDVRTFAGQTITVSFWAKSASGTPNVSFEIGQYFGTGGSPSAFISTTNKLTLTGGTSWTRYSFSYTVPSLSGKTIGTNNDHYLYLGIWVSAGSDFNARSGTLGIQSNTFDFWGVQVEKGSIATPFEQRPIGTELALCQRYYLKEVAGVYVGYGTPVFCASTTSVNSMHKFMVEMRSAPVFSVVSGSPAIDNYGVATGITYGSQYTGTQGAQINWTGSGFTQGRPTTLIGNGNVLTMAWSAEL